jgi:hypothetical protein
LFLVVGRNDPVVATGDDDAAEHAIGLPPAGRRPPVTEAPRGLSQGFFREDLDVRPQGLDPDDHVVAG